MDINLNQASVAKRGVPASLGGWVLAATILGSSLSFIDGTVVNVALPTLQRELNASAGDVQWVVEAYALFLSALLLAGGALGDRFGRKRIFVAGTATFTLASALCGAAPNLAVLVIARAAQGIGGALLVPGSLAIISAYFDENRRGQAIGTWSSFTTITSALGPVLGGWLVQVASWRWIFFINLPLAALTLAITLRYVPESRETASQGPFDLAGALLCTLGLGAVVFGLVESSTLGLGSPVVILMTLGGLALLVAFFALEQRQPAPLAPPALFRSRTFLGANIFTLLLYGALGGTLYFLPFALQQVQGYTPVEAGAALLPFTLIVFALSRRIGGLQARYGAKRFMVGGALIVAGAFVLFALPGIGGSYWTTYFPAVLALSIGMACVITPLTTAVMGAVPRDRTGVASGINNSASRTAGLLAIALLNLVVIMVFSNVLRAQLAPLPIPGAMRATMQAHSARLLAIAIPPGLAPAPLAAVRHALAEAFMVGFRVAMLIGAALALAAAGVAAWLVKGRPRAHPLAHDTCGRRLS
ncbi:MAG TPA: MFS transporter [Ktedonobacterales bacterium]|jgi:EmrB/QacA subfamily drug resistance transporter